VQFVPACVLAGFLAVIGVKIMLKAIDAATSYHVDFAIKIGCTTSAGKSCAFEDWEHTATAFGCVDFWTHLLPAVPYGLSIYLMKKYHVMNPLVLLPLMLGVPLILFYVILVILAPAGGADVDGNGAAGDFLDNFAAARQESWLYPVFNEGWEVGQLPDKFLDNWRTLDLNGLVGWSTGWSTGWLVHRSVAGII